MTENIKRRGYGEGSWKKLPSGNWQIMVSLGRDKKGKRIRKTGTGKTKTQARENLDKKIVEIENKKTHNTTVEEWVSTWLETYKKPNINETSYVTYEHQMRNHFIDPLGSKNITEVTTEDLQILLNTIDTKHSRSLAKAIKSNINACLRKAVQVKLIPYNPCEGTELSKIGGKRKKIEALTKDQQNKLVERCQQEEYANIFIFLLCTGLRLGEALGLTWDNVNLKEKTIHIKEIMVEIKGNPKQQLYPKTDASIRTVPLSKEAYDIIQIRKEISEKDGDLNYLNLVFYSSTFNFRTTANLRRYLQRLVKESGLERDIAPHVLRHTFATRLIEQNCNVKTVSELLGHKKVTTTLDIYTDVFMEQKKDVFDKFSIL